MIPGACLKLWLVRPDFRQQIAIIVEKTRWKWSFGGRMAASADWLLTRQG
jgi:hypothetical protein